MRRYGQRLDLYTVVHSHCGASIFEAGAAKRLQHVRYGIFAEDMAEFGRRLRRYRD